MDNSINIHERIKQIFNTKYGGTKRHSAQKPIPEKKPKQKPAKVKRLTHSEHGRTNLKYEDLQDEDNEYSTNKQYNSKLLNKASQLIEKRELSKKKQKMIDISPNVLENQRSMIESIISRFDDIPQDTLLTQANKRIKFKIEPLTNTDIPKSKLRLPLINSTNVLIKQRKKKLYDWRVQQFKFQQKQNTSLNLQMSEFIQEVDKQKLRNQNFKIKAKNYIQKIEKLQDRSFNIRRFGELGQMKNSYSFHDMFMRYRKIKNHATAQTK